MRRNSDNPKSALITGAAGGMGAALTRSLLSGGWTVFALDHNESRLGALVGSCTDHAERIHPIFGNIEDDNTIRIVESLLAEAGTLTGLVNMAGVSIGDDIEHLEDQDWRACFEVNVTAPMRLSRTAIPFLKASGEGSIVNVSSPVAYAGARKPSYAASKAAMIGLTMSLARNLGKHGIRVNTLLPGTTITYLTSDWSEEKRSAIARENFLGRLCEPEEIASVIEFLLSGAASYMTGSLVDLTAGALWGHG
jgi:NAD(P)-dependent dehydrogenase (short-subunit alcohol dehydrogenase family)